MHISFRVFSLKSALTGGPGFPNPGRPGSPGFPGSPANPSGPTIPGMPWETQILLNLNGLYGMYLRDRLLAEAPRLNADRPSVPWDQLHRRTQLDPGKR